MRATVLLDVVVRRQFDPCSSSRLKIFCITSSLSSLRILLQFHRVARSEYAEGEKLPVAPDSKALNEFLMKRKAADPDHFADLSLAVWDPANMSWNGPDGRVSNPYVSNPSNP